MGAILGADIDTIAGLIAGILFLVVLSWMARRAGSGLVHALYLSYFVLLIGWALLVSSQQISDFGAYFRCGAENWRAAVSIQDWMQKCHSAWLPGVSTYWRRSLLYTLPIGMLGSGSYLVLKLYNAALHLATVAVLYRLVADRVGRAQGVVAAGALAIYPEYWFSTSLATSDNLALLLLVLWLSSLLRCLSDEHAVRRVVCTAVLALALDLLRDIGLICVLATALLAIASSSSVRWRMLGASVFTFGLMAATTWIGAHFAPPPANQAGLFARLVGNSITTTYPWMDVYRWFEYVYPLVPQQYHGPYLTGLLAIDLDHGIIAALHNWMSKIDILFRGAGYYLFSAAPFDANPDNYKVAQVAPTYLANNGFSLFLVGAAAVFTLAALVGVVKQRADGLNRVSIAFCSSFLFFVVGFGESQARYCVLLAPVLSIMISGLLSPKAGTLKECAKQSVGAAVMFAATLCAGFFVVDGVARTVSPNHPAMRFFNQEHRVTINGENCNLARVPIDIRARYVLMSVPPMRPACYSFVFAVEGVVHELHYYVTRNPILPRIETPPPSAISIDVVPLDGGQASQGSSVAMRTDEAFKSQVLALGRERGGFRVILKIDGSADHQTHDIAFGFFHDDHGNPVKLAH